MQTEKITFIMKDERTRDIRMYCFVCTGNTCRSPMAAAMLNEKGAPKGVFAFSRGICAEVGAPISENAAKALENAGVMPSGRNDYTAHIAVQFTKEDFDRCDGVFAISPSHAEALIMAFPEYAGKIRVLGDISDPYGGDLVRYERCLKDITCALRERFPFVFDDEN